MAEGLLQMLGSGQQAQQQQQGNLLGGLFQSESQARRQGRERLLGQALQIAQQQDPIRSGFAVAGGLLGEGIGRAMGKVTPEEARQQKFAGLQTQLMQEGLDPVQNPAGFYTRVAELSQDQGDMQTALRAAAKAREFTPKQQEVENVREVETPEGTKLVGTLNNQAVEVTGQGPVPLEGPLAIEQDRVNVPSIIREYNIGREQGLIPETTSFTEYRAKTVEGTGPQFGTIPQGMQLVEENGAFQLVPIPGGPVAREQEEAKEQAEGREELEERAGEVVFEDIERLTELVEGDSILDPVLGLKGVAAAQFPGTKRVDAENLSETIKANIGFDRLQQMREASPTGGALGQVSNQELKTLQSVLGNLSFSQSQEQLLINLNRLKEIYSRILEKEPALANPNQQPLVFEGSAAPSRRESDSSQNQIDFSNMSRADLLNLNIDDLNESQLREYNSRLDTLLQGGK